MRAKVLPPPLQTSLHSCQVFLCLVMVSHRPKDSGSVLGFPEAACFMISGETLSLTKDSNICCVSNTTLTDSHSLKPGLTLNVMVIFLSLFQHNSHARSLQLQRWPG